MYGDDAWLAFNDQEVNSSSWVGGAGGPLDIALLCSSVLPV